ncbi:MAG: transcription termination factor NusA [Candidatus Berkelbacteria bacterium]|nr:transcription termination factor NusA [Candidatus Berkelbacteria bacterium]
MTEENVNFIEAIEELCEEKGLDKEIVISTVEAALAAAYRKDYGKPRQVIRAKMDPKTGEAEMSLVTTVVEDEELENPEAEISITDAKKDNKKAKVADEIIEPLPKEETFGRIAAQTAKQVIIQRIREAERDMIFSEFKDKEGTIGNGSVQQIEGKNVIVSLGKVNAIMFPSDQIRDERYYVGQRLKVYIKEVAQTSRGPQVLVSRSDEGLIKCLFELEVPEIANGTVEIKSLAREAGSRTKMAVIANDENIDPIGSCVGQRGTRVQSVLAEIGDEKIDIILWDEDVEKFIMNALSPAKCEKIVISSKDNKAIVYVPEDSLSLAIGKNGQNVRLASKLTGWGIDIEKTEGATSSRKDDGGVESSDAPIVESEVGVPTESVGKKAVTVEKEEVIKEEAVDTSDKDAEKIEETIDSDKK